MIAAVGSWSSRWWPLTLLAALALAIAGGWAFQRLPVDALPDLSDNQVVVWTQWPGQSPEDVETQVTARLSRGLQGLAGVTAVRGLSLTGASYVYVVFDERRERYACRTRVLERLTTLDAQLPAGVSPQIGPDATAMGQVFAFALHGKTDAEQQRRVLDQVIVPALQGVPGVAEVAAAGGVVREYQIDVDPVRLEEQALTIDTLATAIRNAGRDVGLMAVERSGVESMLRGVGFVRELRDVERIVIRGDREKGAGVLLRDVATVSVGGAVRAGILADADGEHAGAIVALRAGEDPQTVIDAVKQRLLSLRPTLANAGLTVVPFYDRSQLIGETKHTLTATLREELAVAMLVVLVFLLHTRVGLAIGLVLPLGLALTVLMMSALGVSANLMSLAGIAIAIGVMVDLGIVIAENIYQHLVQVQRELEARGETMPRSPLDPRIAAAVVAGTREVAPALLTATLTTVVGFLPVFALDGQAGRLFHPLALTKTLAIAGAALVALAVVPVACRLLLPPWAAPRWLRLSAAGLAAGATFAWFFHGIPLPLAHGQWTLVVPGWLCAPVLAALAGLLVWRFGAERLRSIEENPVSHAVSRAYAAVLTLILAHKRWFIATCVVIVATGALLGLGWDRVASPLHAGVRALGGELERTAPDRALARAFPGLGESFLPPLDEGALLFMPSIPPHGGLGESLRVMQIQNRMIAAVPEVAGLMGKLGRAETALDPAPIGMVETIVNLKPYHDWPAQDVLTADGKTVHRPRTLTEVRAALSAAVDLPGIAPSWLQPIETRVVMLSTGIRSLIALQLSGDDAQALEQFAAAAEPLLRDVPGAVDVSAQRDGAKPYGEIRLDQERMARFGLSTEQVMMAVDSAIGGMPLAWSVEGNQRYGIRLRYLRERRDDPDELALVQIPAMSAMGGKAGHGAVPLASVVAAPTVFTLAFTSVSPDDFARTLPLEQRRNFTALSNERAELTLPAGELLPTSISENKNVRVLWTRASSDALTYTVGPMSIRSDNGKRSAYVLLNARGRGEVEVVEDADRRLRAALANKTLTLPSGATFRWVGRYEQKLAADRILRVVILASLAMMIALIWLGSRSLVTTAIIVLGSAPIAVAGGMLAVWAAGVDFTTAVTVGFIALLGVVFNDGILIGLYLDEQFRVPPTDVAGVRARVLAAGGRRIRPALMTNIAILLALTPVLWSDGRGAEVLLPMALPSLGGMAVDLLSLFTVPCLYAWWWERRVRTLPRSPAQIRALGVGLPDDGAPSAKNLPASP